MYNRYGVQYRKRGVAYGDNRIWSGAVMDDWRAFVGRISLFPAMPPSSPVPVALDVYRQIWGHDPNTFQRQENPLAPTVAQGRVGGLIVNCVGQQTRFDFNLMGVAAQVSTMTLAMIDHPKELKDELTRIITFLEDEKPALDRIWHVALSLQFISLKENHAEANDALIKVIPSRYGVTLADEEGVVFQISVPRMSGESRDIRMNYITKWSVEVFQVLNITIPAGAISAGSGPVPPPPRFNTFIAASVVFDSNNTTRTLPLRVLNGKEQSALLREALDEAMRKQREIGLNIEEF